MTTPSNLHLPCSLLYGHSHFSGGHIYIPSCQPSEQGPWRQQVCSWGWNLQSLSAGRSWVMHPAAIFSCWSHREVAAGAKSESKELSINQSSHKPRIYMTAQLGPTADSSFSWASHQQFCTPVVQPLSPTELHGTLQNPKGPPQLQQDVVPPAQVTPAQHPPKEGLHGHKEVAGTSAARGTGAHASCPTALSRSFLFSPPYYPCQILVVCATASLKEGCEFAPEHCLAYVGRNVTSLHLAPAGGTYSSGTGATLVLGSFVIREKMSCTCTWPWARGPALLSALFRRAFSAATELQAKPGKSFQDWFGVELCLLAQNYTLLMLKYHWSVSELLAQVKHPASQHWVMHRARGQAEKEQQALSSWSTLWAPKARKEMATMCFGTWTAHSARTFSHSFTRF